VYLRLDGAVAGPVEADFAIIRPILHGHSAHCTARQRLERPRRRVASRRLASKLDALRVAGWADSYHEEFNAAGNFQITVSASRTLDGRRFSLRCEDDAGNDVVSVKLK
jgi:hypothetical protein